MISFLTSTPLRMSVTAILALVLMLSLLHINSWRRDSVELIEVKHRLYLELKCKEGSECQRRKTEERERALTEAETVLRKQQQLALETENVLREKLAEVDRNYLAATERLSRLRVCKPARVPPAAATPAAGEPEPAGPIDEGDGASLAGLGPILRDCELDAAELTALQQWYAALKRSRETDHGR